MYKSCHVNSHLTLMPPCVHTSCSSRWLMQCRQLVLAGFVSRPAWQVKDVSGWPEQAAEDAISCSILHWGEYERFNWQRVHAGQ